MEQDCVDVIHQIPYLVSRKKPQQVKSSTQRFTILHFHLGNFVFFSFLSLIIGFYPIPGRIMLGVVLMPPADESALVATVNK